MKSQKIHLKAEIKDFKLHKVIVLMIDSDRTKDILIPFFLLKEKLTNSIEILLDNLSIYLTHDPKRDISACSVLDLKSKVFKASISMDLLDFAITYFLKYYRDELAEVEHIDLDFDYKNESIVTLVLKVDQYRELSSDEMNKLLGL